MARAIGTGTVKDGRTRMTLALSTAQRDRLRWETFQEGRTGADVVADLLCLLPPVPDTAPGDRGAAWVESIETAFRFARMARFLGTGEAEVRVAVAGLTPEKRRRAEAALKTIEDEIVNARRWLNSVPGRQSATNPPASQRPPTARPRAARDQNSTRHVVKYRAEVDGRQVADTNLNALSTLSHNQLHMKVADLHVQWHEQTGQDAQHFVESYGAGPRRATIRCVKGHAHEVVLIPLAAPPR